MKTLKVKGKVWRIVDTPATRATCDAPNLPGKTLNIPVNGDTEGELAVILHEILHAACWDLSEWTVDEATIAMARALWRLGWRNE